MRGIYIMGGYPAKSSLSDCFKLAESAGFDFVEAGIPFNDPIADGPVIASAGEAALKKGVTTEAIISELEKFKQSPVKRFFMTYSNVVYHYGVKKFSDRVKSFTNGIILADMPNRSAKLFYQMGFEVPIVPFATLETRESDMELINQSKSEIIYFVGLRGITGGVANFKSQEMINKLNMIKKNTDKKIIIGFGIKTAQDTKDAFAIASGFVVGTEAVKRQTDLKNYESYVRELTR